MGPKARHGAGARAAALLVALVALACRAPLAAGQATTEVATHTELTDALDAGRNHIIITDHLDLRQLRAPVNASQSGALAPAIDLRSLRVRGRVQSTRSTAHSRRLPSGNVSWRQACK